MPTLYKRSNGKWYLIWWSGGRQFRKSLRTGDEKIARNIFDDFSARHRLGLIGLPSDKRIPTLRELFDEYLPFCRAHRSARTYRDAKLHIENFLGPGFGHLSAMDLGPKHLEAFIGRLLSWKDERGKPAPYHPRTINLRLETLRKVIRRAVENKEIPSMPCKIRLLKEPKSLPRYAYPAELVKWMQYLDTSHRLRALLSLFTGITDRDLGYVRMDGYDPHNRLLRYRRPKTTTDIAIPLNVPAMRILAILVKDNPGPELFPACTVKHAYYDASIKSKKEGGKNITPHMLRHSFATMLLSSGVPMSHVKDLLGHVNIKTTEQYAKVIPEYLRAAVDKIAIPEFDIETILTAPIRRTQGKTMDNKKSRS